MNRSIFVKIVSLILVISSMAVAAPASMKVKAGLIDQGGGTTTEVSGGIYLNDEARIIVNNTLTRLETQNKQVMTELVDANKKLLEASAYIPGVPGWVYSVVSAVLTGLTVFAGYLVVNPPSWLK